MRDERKCWKCRGDACRTTRVGRAALHYCPEHVPDHVAAFRGAALAALVRGQARRAKAEGRTG